LTVPLSLEKEVEDLNKELFMLGVYDVLTLRKLKIKLAKGENEKAIPGFNDHTIAYLDDSGGMRY
jgi:hypothetical protein